TDALYFSGDDPAEISGHFYDFRAGPFTKLALPSNSTGAFDWDRMAGEAVANSVKYASATYAGFSVGAMYQFGNVAGSIGEANGASFGLNYGDRQLGANAAYTNLKYATTGTATTSVRNWGSGVHASFGKWFTNALFTTVRNSANGGALYEASMGARYNFTNAWNSGVSYMYMKGNSVVDNNHAHQIAAILEYAFSKRTSVYVLGLYQRANEGASARINGLNGSADGSTTNTQSIARVGLRTRF
ncbi:MAG: porin, partial [Janthinobacterium lividum]